MLKIIEKFRGLIALLAVVLTVFGLMQVVAEMGGATL